MNVIHSSPQPHLVWDRFTQLHSYTRGLATRPGSLVEKAPCKLYQGFYSHWTRVTVKGLVIIRCVTGQHELMVP
jgi:hypothetical protein